MKTFPTLWRMKVKYRSPALPGLVDFLIEAHISRN
jgi:hypothetical protein